MGEEATVETYLHVREDALQLYGFASADERELFELLLGVSGVEVLVRLSAFFLMCIGIEFLWSGYLALTAAHGLQ